MMDLITTLDRFSEPGILVVGDIILDQYTWGNAERVSPEAPVMVLKVDRREVRLGGAASVALLAKHLGARVAVAGVIGDDSAGRTVSRLLSDEGISTSGIVRGNDRPTTTKERMIGRAAQRHPFQMLRVDEEVTLPVSSDAEDQLLAAIERELPSVQIVLVADYAKGVCTPRLLERVFDLCKSHRVLVVVDPARGADIARYRGATILKPNRSEASLATGVTIKSASQGIVAAQRLVAALQLDAAVITLDSDGIVIASSTGEAQHFPTAAQDVYDITGAGDLTLAVIGVGMASEVAVEEVIPLANVAAGLEIQHHGVTPIGREAIRAAILADYAREACKRVELAEASRLAEVYRRNGRRVVLTNGCFDLLHAGHISCLQQAARLGDVLFVALNSDHSIRRLKGPDRPIYHEEDRVQLVSALGCVAHVVVFDEETPHALLDAIRPDCLVKGGTYRVEDVVGHEIVEGYGGEVRVTLPVPNRSTTRTISLLQEAKQVAGHNLLSGGECHPERFTRIDEL